jgi:hypothetical protein
VSDLDRVLTEGTIYEFLTDEMTGSRGLRAALRGRWMIETDESGKPLKKASPKPPPPAGAGRAPEVEADMYPGAEQGGDDEAELARVSKEETALHFDDEELRAADEAVATPRGVVGPALASQGTASKTGRRGRRRPMKGAGPIGPGA